MSGYGDVRILVPDRKSGGYVCSQVISREALIERDAKLLKRRHSGTEGPDHSQRIVLGHQLENKIIAKRCAGGDVRFTGSSRRSKYCEPCATKDVKKLNLLIDKEKTGTAIRLWGFDFNLVIDPYRSIPLIRLHVQLQNQCSFFLVRLHRLNQRLQGVR